MEEVRWRECVSYVNSNMESAVGSLYIKRAFSKDSKSTVRIQTDSSQAYPGSATWQEYQFPSSPPHPVTPMHGRFNPYSLPEVDDSSNMH